MSGVARGPAASLAGSAGTTCEMMNVKIERPIKVGIISTSRRTRYRPRPIDLLASARDEGFHSHASQRGGAGRSAARSNDYDVSDISYHQGAEPITGQ